MRLKRKLALLLTTAMLITNINIAPIPTFAAEGGTDDTPTPAKASTTLTLDLSANKGYVGRPASGSTKLTLVIAPGHDWGYSVGTGSDANKLTAKCKTEEHSSDSCHTKGVSLTVSASGSTAGIEATINIGTEAEKTAWTDAKLTVPTTVSYEKADGTDLGTTAPTNAGSYVAKVSPVGETASETNTAKVSFTIAKLESTATAPTAKEGLVYTGTALDLVNDDGRTTCGTLQYALSSSGTFSADIPKGTDAGSYNVYYKVAGDVNHEDKVFDPVAVTISKATYAGTDTATGHVLAGNASNDIEVVLPAIPEHMTYGTPSYSVPITSAAIKGNVLEYSADSTAVVGNPYTITVPVSQKSGESANYNNYNITVTLTGIECSHSNKKSVSVVAAKCDEDGVKAHDVCLDCGVKLINGEAVTDENLKIAMLGHNWVYTNDGATLKASCSRRATCGKEDVTLTISTTNPEYTGGACEGINLGDTTAWTDEGLSVPTIMYVGRDGTEYESETAPTAIGKYTAKISVGSPAVTATSDFEITKIHQDVPGDNEGYEINYEEETITPSNDDYEVGTTNDDEVTPLTGDKLVPGKGYYVRKKGNEDHDPSPWKQITVAPSRPEKPTGIEKVNPTDKTSSDGKITGVNETIEYSTDDGTTWKPVTGTEITGLKAGKIRLRVKATPTSFASESVEIILHGHDWKYLVTGDKIEAYCACENCPSGTDVEHKIILIIKAETATPSETDPYEVTFEGEKEWEEAGLPPVSEIATIKYYKATEEGGTEGTEEVTDRTGLPRGNYYVVIIIGDETIKKAFKIESNEEAFKEFAEEKEKEAEDLKIENELPVIEDLIDDAIEEIKDKEYDPEKSLEDNKKVITEIIVKLVIEINIKWTYVPTGVEKVNPSSETSSDGKITGVDDTMEYSTDGEKTWKPVEEGETEIKDLPSGDINIRRKAIPEKKREAGEALAITLKYVDSNPTARYTVEFISKGDVVKTYSDVLTGSLITEPAKPDFAGFAGWYKDEACTTLWDFDLDKISADTKIYAKYVETVTVKLDANGGTFAEGTETVLDVKINQKLDEKTLDEIAAKASNGAMVFSGWYKDEYSAEAWDFTEDLVTEDTTLYIGWGYPAGHEEVAELSVTRVKDYIYTGKKITPAVSVSFGGKVLVPGTDYTVSYKNNVKAYTSVSGNNLVIKEDGSIDYSNVDTKYAPSIIIKGKKNYSSKTIALNFNILPVVLGDKADTLGENVSADICDNYATNKKGTIKVKGTVSYKGKKLKSKDYTLTLVPENAKDASGSPLPKTELAGQKIPKGASGTFKLTVAGKGNYAGGFVKTITVADSAKTLQKAKISVKKIPYSGHDLTADDIANPLIGKLTVKLSGKTLTYGTDYEVEFADKDAKAGSRTNGGIYPIVIKGKGAYVGTRMVNVTVNGVSIKKAVVTFSDTNPVYTGHHIGANIKSVSVNGITKGLTAGIDYDVVVKNDVKAGKASVTVTGKGIYAGTKKVSYKIQKKKLTNEMLGITPTADNVIDLGKYDYRGGIAVTPNVSISYNGMKLINPADYSISLKNNKKAGKTAKATIKGKGNYTGSVSAIFTIGEDKIDRNKVNIKKAKVRVFDQTYTGREITISGNDIKSAKISVKVGKKSEPRDLTLGTDFEIISYVKNVNVGKAQIIIKGIGKYDGYKAITFKITKKDLKWWQKKVQ